jgi:hypothetical protein
MPLSEPSPHVEDRKAYERYHNGKIEHHEQLIGNAEQSIEDNKNRLEELKIGLPTESEFYELVNLPLVDLLETNDIMKLDAICNEMVTNLRVGNDSVSVIKLNPPYNLLVDLAEISTGRDKRLLLELFEYIIEEPDLSHNYLVSLRELPSVKHNQIENLIF